MPLIIPRTLPAYDALYAENIFVMHRERALSQHIRPLEIAILNLMPTKIATETQIARLLANSPLQVHMTLLQTASHAATHVSAAHLEAFYKTFDEVRDRRFDGMIITGAPVETIPFEQVDYWDELCGIMDWSKSSVYSTLHVCWGAQAGLYHHYGVRKELLPEKMFGIFPHRVTRPANPLVRGFDEVFYAPHSRPLSAEHRERPADLCHRAPRVRQADPRRRIPPGRGQRAAHRAAQKLLPRQRPGPAARFPLAGPRPSALFQLAELLRLPEHPLRPEHPGRHDAVKEAALWA